MWSLTDALAGRFGSPPVHPAGGGERLFAQDDGERVDLALDRVDAL
jgi:hypothetical protein